MRIRYLMTTAIFGACVVLSVPALAQKGAVRTIQGQAFWDGDPGPISEPYWTQGQYKYDPNGYLERNARDPDQFHLMTVIGDHAGKPNCVFRRRVTVSTWDFQHPILRVCRAPPKD